MDYEQLLKKYRKKPIALLDDFSVKTSLKQNDIEKIIPHRDPFLLVDEIKGIDLKSEQIIGYRLIKKDDPVFKGHFPEYPVYPGSLQLEMTGQLGLCLSYFLINNCTSINENSKPVQIRATRIIGAHFLQPVYPGKIVTIAVQKLEYDTFFGSVIGQVISDEKICSVSISEVCFLD